MPNLELTDIILQHALKMCPVREYPHSHSPWHTVHVYEMDTGEPQDELHVVVSLWVLYRIERRIRQSTFCAKASTIFSYKDFCYCVCHTGSRLSHKDECGTAHSAAVVFKRQSSH
jgi:hypothetical protein